MTTTPNEPLRDDEMETTQGAGVPGPTGDADGTDGDATDTVDGDSGDAGDSDGTDGDATDTVDGDSGDSDGTDS